MFRRAVLSTTLPARMDWHRGVSWNTNGTSYSLSVPSAPLWPLLYLKDRPSALAHSCIFLEIKLTWNHCARRDTERPAANTTFSDDGACVERSDYIAPLICISFILCTDMHTHAHTCTCKLTDALSVSQISQSAGLSLAGCSKGNCGPKKYWLCGYHGNSLPRGVGCLLNCSLVC